MPEVDQSRGFVRDMCDAVTQGFARLPSPVRNSVSITSMLIWGDCYNIQSEAFGISAIEYVSAYSMFIIAEVIN